jgi:putative IMPACT (imprinted ancient) family translation regulator
VNTVKNETIIEFEEKKSKFIGYIKPITTIKEAEKFIESIKAQHPNARTQCASL